MAQQKLMRRETPSKLNQGLSVSKVSSVCVTQSNGKRDTLSLNLDKGTPLSLIASPTIIKKFRRKTEDSQSYNHDVNKRTSKVIHSRQFIVDHQFDSEESSVKPRSSTWNGHHQECSDPIPLAVVNQDPSVNDKIKKFSINMERKSKSLKKLRELVEKVLRKNLEHQHYDSNLSRRRCTHLSQILETTFKSSLNVGTLEYKVVAIVYIGEIRDDGMRQSCQYNWNPATDFFVMETYRREDMFATGIVFATLLETKDEAEETSNHIFDERLENHEIML